MGRLRGMRVLVLGVFVLAASGCAAAAAPTSTAPPVASVAPIPTPTATSSGFEQQLPLAGTFVSQAATTSGSVRIERGEDGVIRVVLSDFATGDATDLRLYLKADPLVQDADGYWGSSENGYEIATIDPEASNQEIAVPGAWTMPAMYTLSVVDYFGPDYPSLGSAALG
jgi:hypothetical protein